MTNHAATDAPVRRVLVTGAGGFIGRHLVADQLQRGNEVVALDLHLDGLAGVQSGSLRCLEGDVGNAGLVREAVQNADTVFHLAAAHLEVSSGAEEFQRVNVAATAELAAACEEAGIRRFVHCSTVGVYGVLHDPPADEDTPCAPEFDYERTKLRAEELLLTAHRERGFPVVVLRPAWVYGPGCPRTDKLFRAIARRRFAVAGAGHALRHSVYIRDAVRAFELASATDALGHVFIVADGGAITVRALVDEVAALEGVPAPRSVPAWLLHAAGLTAELVYAPLRKEPPVSRRSLRFFQGNTAFVTDKATRILGFHPAYSIHDGLAETKEIRDRDAFWTLPLPDTPRGQ